MPTRRCASASACVILSARCHSRKRSTTSTSALHIEEPAAAAVIEPPTTDKLQKFKDEAGHRREGLVVETTESVAENVVELLTFIIAGENYAVHIENIVEIVTPRPVTRIPN